MWWCSSADNTAVVCYISNLWMSSVPLKQYTLISPTSIDRFMNYL